MLDYTIADVEHRRHLVNGDKLGHWKTLDWQQSMILLFNGFAILQKDTLHKVMKLLSLVQEMNQKERLLRNKLVNGL